MAGAPQPHEEPSDEALMLAYTRGDAVAFEKLFARLAPRIHGFFLRSFGRPVVADDLLQATFLKIHNARSSYQAERPLRPWVFAIAARVRLDELRRIRRLPEDGSEEALARAEAALAVADATDSGPPGEVATTVQAALDRLP